MAERTPFGGRLVMLGYGSVGQCVLPVIPHHFDMPLDRVLVLEEDDHTERFAPFAAMGMRYTRVRLTPHNLHDELARHLSAGDLVINLTAGVDAIAIMEWAQAHGVLYVDTSLEPWADKYEDTTVDPWTRTHYDAHNVVRKMASGWAKGGATTIVTHGANPGMVNHFVKAALLEVALRTGLDTDVPSNRTGWAALAEQTGTKVIHIAERDTQRSRLPKAPGEFVNTWSVLGFWGEAYYPAELGWGTHEKAMPPFGKAFPAGGPNDCIYLEKPGGSTLVRSWVPRGGSIYGFVISHSESVTLSRYFTVKDDKGVDRYRPTVHYAYHPTSDAIVSLRELIMRDWSPPSQLRIMQDDIVEGIDELGVLLMGHGRNALWYGSQLSIHEARQIIPGQNATALQVCAGVISAAVWAVRNPDAGFLEPEDLPHDEILAIARPYLGPVVAVESDWTPLKGRSTMFPEPWLDKSDPWQFGNFLVR